MLGYNVPVETGIWSAPSQNIGKVKNTGFERNQLAEVADRWSPTNASNKVPRYNGYVVNDVYSRFVEDGSFLRLKNITLGYTLPHKWTRSFHVSTSFSFRTDVFNTFVGTFRTERICFIDNKLRSDGR